MAPMIVQPQGHDSTRPQVSVLVTGVPQSGQAVNGCAP